MVHTAVSKLKASLSAYLDRVKAGEEVLVTERGKPVAKLVPVRDAALPGHLRALERQGAVRLGSGELPADIWDMPRPKDAGGEALAALLKDREEDR